MCGRGQSRRPSIWTRAWLAFRSPPSRRKLFFRKFFAQPHTQVQRPIPALSHKNARFWNRDFYCVMFLFCSSLSRAHLLPYPVDTAEAPFLFNLMTYATPKHDLFLCFFTQAWARQQGGGLNRLFFYPTPHEKKCSCKRSSRKPHTDNRCSELDPGLMKIIAQKALRPSILSPGSATYKTGYPHHTY